MAKIKVSQATIDGIKKMGMEAALKKAGSASPEMKEALVRMYGAKRVQAAGGAKATPAVAKSADAARNAATKVSKPAAKPTVKATTKPVVKTADAARAAASKTTSTPVTRGKAAVSSKTSTTSNPVTAVFNKVSPYGNKEQKFKSPLGDGLATKKPVAGKPSIGEKISNTLSGKSTGGSKKTTTSVAAENAKRMGISASEYNRRLNKGK
jgi:hypothetical protein